MPAGLFGRFLSVTVPAPAPGSVLPPTGETAASDGGGSERDECATGGVSPGSRSDKTAKACENECSPEAVSPDDADRGPSAGPQPVRHELQDDDPADAVALPQSGRPPDAAAELKPFVVQQFLPAQMRLEGGMAALSTVGSVMAGGVMRTQPVLPGGDPALTTLEKGTGTNGGAEGSDSPAAASAGKRSVSAARADAVIRHSPLLSGHAALAAGLQPAVPDTPLQSAQQQRELPNMTFAPGLHSSRDPMGRPQGPGDGLRAGPVEAVFGGDHQSVRRIDNGVGMASSEHRAASIMAGGVMRTQPVPPGGDPALLASEKATATDGGAGSDSPAAASAGKRSVSAARADAVIRHSPLLSGHAALAAGLQPAVPDTPLQSAQQQRELPNMTFAPGLLSSRDPVGGPQGPGDGFRAGPVEAAFGGDHQSVRRIDNRVGMAGSEHRTAEVEEARRTQVPVPPERAGTPRPEASTDLQNPEPERQLLRAEPAAPLEKAGPADDPSSEARQPPLRRGAQNVTAKGASLHTAAPFFAPPQSASDVALGNAGSAVTGLEPASDVAMQPLPVPDDVNRMPEASPFAVFASPAHATAPAGASMIPVIGQIADQLASRLGALTDGAAAEPVRSGLMLAPPELGRVVIRLDPEPLGAVLVLQVERPETLELMRRHQDLLQAALQALGQSGCELRLEAQGRGHDGPSHHASALRLQDPQAENSAARAASEPPADSLRRREDGRLDLRL